MTYPALYVMTLAPVVLGSLLASHYGQPQALIPLLIVEWALVIWAARILSPWRPIVSSLVVGGFFLLASAVSAFVVTEYISLHHAVWSWSDDYVYLQQAQRAARAIHTAGWNLPKAWTVFGQGRPWPWTLSGWPIMLGVVTSTLASGASLPLLHAVALSLNATFLTLAMLLVAHLVKQPVKNHPKRFFLWFSILMVDPLIYAGTSRKESFLQLSMVLAFVAAWKACREMKLVWIVPLCAATVALATTRIAYIPVIVLVCYWLTMRTVKVPRVGRALLALVVVAPFVAAIMNYHIRTVDVAELMFGRTLHADIGTGLRLYNIPVVGPIVYYMLAPLLPLPWHMLQLPATATVRGLGSIAWACTFAYVVFRLVKNRGLLNDDLFLMASVVVLATFAATVLYAGDPRFKQPSDPFLLIVAMLSWYARKRKGRVGLLRDDLGSSGKGAWIEETF